MDNGSSPAWGEVSYSHRGQIYFLVDPIKDLWSFRGLSFISPCEMITQIDRTPATIFRNSLNNINFNLLWSLSDEIIIFKHYIVCPKSFQYEIWRFGLRALWKEIWQFQILHDSFCKNPQNYATRLRRQTNLQVWVC